MKMTSLFSNLVELQQGSFFCHASNVFTLEIKLHLHFDGYISHSRFSRHRSASVWPICLPPPTEDFTNRRAFVIGERVRWKWETPIKSKLSEMYKTYPSSSPNLGWGTIYFGGPVSPTLQEVTGYFAYSFIWMSAQFFNHARTHWAYIFKGILTFCLNQIDFKKRLKKHTHWGKVCI